MLVLACQLSLASVRIAFLALAKFAFVLSRPLSLRYTLLMQSHQSHQCTESRPAALSGYASLFEA